jgi:pre-mRNA-splicing helicase BRR2
MADVLRMVGFAGRFPTSRFPTGDASATCLVLCRERRRPFFRRHLHEALPVESHLDQALADPLNAEVVAGAVSDKQDAVDWLTWTFFYRRVSRNPNYYNLEGRTHQHVSDHLSDLVEQTAEELSEAQCLRIGADGMALKPLNLGMIAAYYDVRHTTVELFASSLAPRTKLRGVLQILSAAAEFDDLEVRPSEHGVLARLARHLPQKVSVAGAGGTGVGTRVGPHFKANVLLQAHFGRLKVASAAMRADQRRVVGTSVVLLRAMVDVVSSSGWLRPALAAMELAQMVVQARWSWDHPLLQIPHFDRAMLERCEAHNRRVESSKSASASGKSHNRNGQGDDDDDDGDDDDGPQTVETVFDLLEIDDDVRNDLLRLPPTLLSDVAVFCNAFPTIEVEHRVTTRADEIRAGEPVELAVRLEREPDEESDEEEAHPATAARGPGGHKRPVAAEAVQAVAPRYPKAKAEGWWIVVGSVADNSLLSIKRAAVPAEGVADFRMEFAAPDRVGPHKLTLFFMSDSYLRCDQEYTFSIDVAEGEASSSGSEGEESAGEE